MFVPVRAHANTHMMQDGMMASGGQQMYRTGSQPLQRTGSPAPQHGHSPQVRALVPRKSTTVGPIITSVA